MRIEPQEMEHIEQRGRCPDCGHLMVCHDRVAVESFEPSIYYLACCRLCDCEKEK